MLRTVLLLSSLFVTACTVGAIPEPGTGDDDGSGSMSNGCMNRLSPAVAFHPHAAPVSAASPDNRGLNCNDGMCHTAGNSMGAPVFYAAGTIFKADGTTPDPGVAVVISNAAGMTDVLNTDTGGNFYAEMNVDMTFPMLGDLTTGKVTISACPGAPTLMADSLGSNFTMTGCGSAQCHATSIATPTYGAGAKMVLAGDM